jgi:hypothetical protein
LRRFRAIAAALLLAACAAAAPKTREIVSHAVPEGEGRLYVLRERHTVYSALPLTISIDGKAAGTLENGAYLALDLPAAPHRLGVAALLSHASAPFELKPGENLYVEIAMTASGLPPPRGAVGGGPAYPIVAETELFAGLSPR